MKEFFKKRVTLALTLVGFVFCVMVASFIIGWSIVYLLHIFGLLDSSLFVNKGHRVHPLFGLFFICILLGTSFSAFLSKKMLKPIKKVIDATGQVANGNFDVKVDVKGICELEELSKSFNKMTDELSSIETLRSDFINNFSHEFKTPIVSIRGFAKLLRDADLTEEEQLDYLNIIISESERLASLSTNVLTLSKYENIEIVTDKQPYRLDEQIRRAIVMLEPKWSLKDLNMNIDLAEVIFNGNEDLVQQIWLNLLDNAIKFSEVSGAIDINLVKDDTHVKFTIKDTGIGMNEDTLSRIFDKFYQGDKSHSNTGNGLGLSVAKRIVSLCDGNIEAESKLGDGSTFTVLLKI